MSANKVEVKVINVQSLAEDIEKAKQALNDYRDQVKAKRMPYMDLYDADLECSVNIAKRAMERFLKRR